MQVYKFFDSYLLHVLLYGFGEGLADFAAATVFFYDEENELPPDFLVDVYACFSFHGLSRFLFSFSGI